MANRRRPRCFLFLQGPISPFFPLMADALEAKGHRCVRINLCFGDRLFWRRPGAINYRGSLDDWTSFIADYLDREAVTDVLLLGEQRDHHRAAIRAAHDRGIRVVVTDFGYLRPDWITFELDGMSGDSRFPRDPDRIRELAANAPPVRAGRAFSDSFPGLAARDMLYHISSWLLWWLYPGYRSHHVHHPVAVYWGTGVRLWTGFIRNYLAGRVVRDAVASPEPFFVFPLQMEHDFQIRVYSPFANLSEPIDKVLASFARHAPAEARLVVKIHPLDPDLRGWRSRVGKAARRHGIADRVRYIDGGSLELLLEHAAGVVTVNSTVGLTAIRSGVPVKALGEAIYNVPGLVHHGDLDGFWKNPKSPDPSLAQDLVRALAACIQIRGVYYARKGVEAAVAAAVDRLDRERLNCPIDAAVLPHADPEGRPRHGRTPNVKTEGVVAQAS